MSKSDGAFLALNTFLLLWAFIGIASADMETLLVGAMLAMAVAAANGVRIYRNREGREPRSDRRRRSATADEMDARTVLELDARLEALERREREVEEAERIRALVAQGRQSAPHDGESARLGAEGERVRA